MELPFMTKKKHAAREALKEASDKLVAEIWDGQWEHLKKRSIVCREIVTEMERRCPGHTKSEYEGAIARSWIRS
jgi:hypothetical protein